MEPDGVSSLAREALAALAVSAGPILGAMLVVGLVVGVAQAVTQVNDPAVSFLPRLIALLGMCALGGSLIINDLARFFTTCVNHMAGL